MNINLISFGMLNTATNDHTISLGKQLLTAYYVFQKDDPAVPSKSLTVIDPSGSVVFLDDSGNFVNIISWQNDLTIGIDAYKKTFTVKVLKDLKDGTPISFQIAVDTAGNNAILDSNLFYKS